MNWDKPFWRGLWRDGDGSPSSSRVLTTAVVLSSIAWISYLVVKTAAFPVLGPVGSFVTDVTLGLYGVNRLASMGQGIAGVFGKFKGDEKQ